MRVVIAEDDAVSRKVLEKILLKSNYEVATANDGLQAWRILQSEDAPQLAILDWMMPGKSGLQICRDIRELGNRPYTYIMLLTSKSQNQEIVEALAAGADDYLTKPVEAGELTARLRVARRVLELQDEIWAAREAVRYRVQATHDPLTGVWNRGAGLDLLGRELARSERDKSPVSVVLADLDHFKRVNDTYGHLTGDAVLREAARRMSALMRPYDVVVRYGGEELMIILPGCDAAQAMETAERVRTEIRRAPIETSEGPIPLTASLGVASSSQTAMPYADALILAADAALYQSKQSGRNRATLASVADSAPAFLE